MARRYCPAGPQKKNRAGRQSLAQIDCNLSNLNPPVGFTEIWSGCRAGPVLPLTPIIATIDRPLRGAIGVPRWFYLSHRIDTQRHHRDAGAPRRRCRWAEARRGRRVMQTRCAARRWWLAALACFQSQPHRWLRRWPGGFRADNPHGDGNRSLALAGTLRAVVGMDDGRRLGGHGAIVGQSPDMKSPPRAAVCSL